MQGRIHLRPFSFIGNDQILGDEQLREAHQLLRFLLPLLQILLRYFQLRSLCSPHDAKYPPPTAMPQELDAVDPSTERRRIVIPIAGFIRAPHVDDVAKIFCPSSNLSLAKSVCPEPVLVCILS